MYQKIEEDLGRETISLIFDYKNEDKNKSKIIYTKIVYNPEEFKTLRKNQFSGY